MASGLFFSHELYEVKLNSDASVTDDHARTGGIIRDCNGDVLLAYSGSGGTRSVLYQELKAIYDGLLGCEILQKRQILVA
ncbi:hypothetical protein IFM89_008360 [Coptis chinensis]|uniref:RNase H type-1 domain-containing protein n=1 Tax=Coptis chinensis TaxID=261450 RepID=A0A835IN96_9MAGN|nr:hypothetical protein IFM89_008360 [Coptis chinensis]